MIPYILIFLLASLMFYGVSDTAKNIKFPYAVFIVLFASFVGLRDMIGGFDVYIYGEMFETTRERLMAYEPFELGFRYYFLILKMISENRYFMFFVTAFIVIIIQFNILRKHSKVVFFGLFIYFCKFSLMNFVYLRQFLAMCFIWFSLRFIIKRQLAYYCLCVFLAFNFHKSSILFFPIYFIYNMKFNTLKMLFILLGTLVIALSPLNMLLFSSLAESADNDKINLYVEAATGAGTGINFFYFLEILIIIYLILKFRPRFYQTKYGTFILNGMFVYILVSALALTNATFVRFGWYFFIFIIIGMTYIYDYIEVRQQKKMFKNLTFLYFGILYLRLVIVLDGGDFMPYKTFFQDFDRHGQFDWMEYRTR